MPVMPPANTTGTNTTATREAVIETMVEPISFAPCSVAARAAACRRRCMADHVLDDDDRVVDLDENRSR